MKTISFAVGRTLRVHATLLLALCLAGSATAAVDLDRWADAIVLAKKRNQPIKAYAGTATEISEQDAYEVQRLVLLKLTADGDVVVGHKVGLTTDAAQAQFDRLAPVAGGVLKSYLRPNGAFINLRQYPGLVIEMEIGFELKLSIRAAPADVDELRGMVRQIRPILELPRMAIEPQNRATGLDVIAGNVGATLVVTGEPISCEGRDLRTVLATLKRDGETISEGRGTDALGDPWEALLWLVRERLRQGFEIKRNDLLITGALGDVVVAGAGRYAADFGDFGHINLIIK